MAHSITSGMQNRTRTLYYGVLAILSLIGLVALIVRFVKGMSVTALTSPIAWGMWVAFYIYFIGLSAGSFLLAASIYVFGIHRYEKVGRIALLSALFSLIAGFVFVWIDLGQPWRAWKMFTRWNYTSLLAWEGVAYLFYALVLPIMLWTLMRCDIADLVRRTVGWRQRLYRLLTFGFRCPESESEYQRCHRETLRIVKTLGIIGIVTAIVIRGGTAALFAVVVAKPYWNTALLPVIFLVSALASAAALLTFLYAFFGRKDEDHLAITRGMARLMAILIGVELFLFANELLIGLYGKVPEHLEIYHAIFFGPFPYTFWIGHLLLGAIIPMALVLLPHTRNSAFWLGLGGLSALIGIVAVRLNFVIPPYVVPVLEGLDHAIHQPRWAYSYFPSFWEWASSIGTIALVVFLFSLAFQFLPIFHEFPERLKSQGGGAVQ